MNEASPTISPYEPEESRSWDSNAAQAPEAGTGENSPAAETVDATDETNLQQMTDAQLSAACERTKNQIFEVAFREISEKSGLPIDTVRELGQMKYVDHGKDNDGRQIDRFEGSVGGKIVTIEGSSSRPESRRVTIDGKDAYEALMLFEAFELVHNSELFEKAQIEAFARSAPYQELERRSAIAKATETQQIAEYLARILRKE